MLVLYNTGDQTKFGCLLFSFISSVKYPSSLRLYGGFRQFTLSLNQIVNIFTGEPAVSSVDVFHLLWHPQRTTAAFTYPNYPTIYYARKRSRTSKYVVCEMQYARSTRMSCYWSDYAVCMAVCLSGHSDPQSSAQRQICHKCHAVLCAQI